jgi:ribosome-binding protein aMBF1 (putative translation factor)
MLLTKEQELKDMQGVNSVELEKQRVRKYSQEPAVVSDLAEMEFEIQFGKKMLEQRLKLEMKQEDLARLVNTTPIVIDHFENARFVKKPKEGDVYPPMNLELMEKIKEHLYILD